jgi:hypothetical protein
MQLVFTQPGSFSEVGLGRRHFRFTPSNGHQSDIAACPRSADFVGEVGDDELGGWRERL